MEEYSKFLDQVEEFKREWRRFNRTAVFDLQEIRGVLSGCLARLDAYEGDAEASWRIVSDTNRALVNTELSKTEWGVVEPTNLGGLYEYLKEVHRKYPPYMKEVEDAPEYIGGWTCIGWTVRWKYYSKRNWEYFCNGGFVKNMLCWIPKWGEFVTKAKCDAEIMRLQRGEELEFGKKAEKWAAFGREKDRLREECNRLGGWLGE